MRQTIRLVLMGSLAVAIVAANNISKADVLGGYIDSYHKELLLVIDSIAAQKIMLGASLESIRLGEGNAEHSGRLIVVHPNGSWQISTRSFKDKTGLSVAVPADKFDKVVYVNSRKIMIGGIGLSDSEISKFMTARKINSKEIRFLNKDRQAGLFEAMDLAASAVRDGYKLADAERAEMFHATIGMTAGADAQHLISAVMNAADENEFAPRGLLEEVLGIKSDFTTEKLLRGVDLVSEGDNGGPFLESTEEGDNGGPFLADVEEGDNGGPFIKGVDEGDNGGPFVESVDEGDNGGPFAGTIIGGWKDSAANLSVIIPSNLSAECNGTIVLIF